MLEFSSTLYFHSACCIPLSKALHQTAQPAKAVCEISHIFLVKSVYCGGKTYRKIIENVKTKDALKRPYEATFLKHLLEIVALLFLLGIEN